MTIKNLLKSQYSFNNNDLFEALDNDISTILLRNMETHQFKAGEPIFNEGEKPKGIYKVIQGKVKKFTKTNFGAEHIFYICKENEFLGHHAVLSEEYYPDAAMAIIDSEIQIIPEEDFRKAVDSSHQLSKRLLKNLGHEFGVFINATKMLAKYTVRERTALNLLILEEKYHCDNTDKTEIIINREDLASMVGTAKESVVRMLKDFKEEQLITTQRSSIFIEDYAGLVKVANLL